MKNQKLTLFYMWDAPDQLRGPVPEELSRYVNRFITPELISRVMDERDEGHHGRAIVDVLEERLPIKGGLKAAYEHPSTELIFNRGSGAVILVMEKPENLVDGEGSIHLVCDQYAELAKSVLIPRLSTQAHSLKVVSHRQLGIGEHVGAQFKVGERRHESRGVPRWYKSVDRWRKSESIAGGFLWEVRNIGRVIKEKDWDQTTMNYFPYTEFLYEGGHALIAATLLIVQRKSGREEVWVSLKIMPPMGIGEVMEAIYVIPPERLDGTPKDAAKIDQQTLFLRRNLGVNEIFHPTETVRKNAIETIVGMVSKKLTVS